MVDASVVNLDSALKYQAAIALMRGDKKLLADLAGQSPFKLIQSMQGMYLQPGGNIDSPLNLRAALMNTTPANYAGELFNPELSEIEPGAWYFDLSDKTLNYRVRNDEFFHSDLSDAPVIKLRVVVGYNDINADDRFDPDIDIYHSIQLSSVGNYFWVD